MSFSHYSVMLDEAVSALCPENGGVFVDGTAGGGGHSEEIIKRLPEGSVLISLDRDDRAIAHCKERLSVYGAKSMVVKSNYSEFESVLDELYYGIWAYPPSSLMKPSAVFPILRKRFLI